MDDEYLEELDLFNLQRIPVFNDGRVADNDRRKGQGRGRSCGRGIIPLNNVLVEDDEPLIPPLHSLKRQTLLIASGTDKKEKKRLSCRHCSTSAKRTSTSWYCTSCQVGLHPNCFQEYHVNPNFRPPTKKCVVG